MIQIKNLEFKYDEHPILQGIDLDIKEGEFICIIGNNGSGKSTLAMNLNGILQPTSGVVYIDDISTLNEELIFEIRKKVGIVFQNPDNQIISSVVDEDVAFGLENLGTETHEIEEIVYKSLEMVGLDKYKKHLTNKLSGGEKQKLAIAGILAMNPKYIIFDEATSMLDKKGADQVLNIIKKLKKENNVAIILITHNMEEVVFADRVITIHNGKIVLEGTPIEIFKDIPLLEELGLDIPLGTKLIYELKKEGIDISTDNVLTCDDCVNSLCRLMNGVNLNDCN